MMTDDNKHSAGVLHVVSKESVVLKQPTFDEEELAEEEKSLTGEIKGWDEGGASDCGYSDIIHSTLMGIGGSIHSVIGDPSLKTRHVQTTIGNWFQELSYATRDIVRGEGSEDMKKDASDAMSELFQGGHDVLQATGSTISAGVAKTNSFLPNVGAASA
jgi:hypothetical protein